MGISGKSHINLRQISGISQAYLRLISDISQSYLRHIEKLTGGVEKCTVEVWRGGEMPKCDRQSDTQTHRKVFL